jgi:tRNA(fMet)-specific endonuclease VapC
VDQALNTYLFDTNIIVFVIRGLKERLNPTERQLRQYRLAGAIVQRAQQEQLVGSEILVSAITVAELEFGCWQSGNYQKENRNVRAALAPFALVPFDAEATASHYGRVRHSLERKGKGIGSLDTLLAAHALSLGAILVTNNTSEFSRVPDLKCENWP